MSIVIAEFSLETDVKYAEQQVRDRTSSARRKFPDTGVEESIIRRIDPADQPVVVVALSADLSPAQIFELADKKVRTKFEQIPSIGQVDIIGGRKREIQVQLDRNKLQDRELSVNGISARIATAGQNIPVGKVEEGKQETVIRTVAEFRELNDIENAIVNFVGNENAVTVKDVGRVVDGLEDEKTRAFYNNYPGWKGPSLGNDFTMACMYALLAHFSTLRTAEKQGGVAPHIIRFSAGTEKKDQMLGRVDEAMHYTAAA